VLGQYGERLRPSRELAAVNSWLIGHPTAMTFPPLGRPATAQDVRRGEAIFTLEGEGRARQVGLPAGPMKARWTALKKYPYESQWVAEDGTRGSSTGYYQDGFVWQAEEAFKEGKWRRYYGFVGPGSPAKVPAEETEFPRDG